MKGAQQHKLFGKQVCTLALVVLFSTSCASPRPWTKEEKTAAGIFALGHLMDVYTTGQMLDKGYHEKNPVLKEHPSNKKVTAYFSITGTVVLALSHFFPSLRRPFLLGCGSLGLSLAVHNNRLD